MRGLQDRRVWLGGGAALIVAVVLLGWFMAINPRLSAAASRRNEAASVKQQNSVLAVKLSRLKKQNEHLTNLTTQLQGAVAALPFDTGLPAFTRQVSGQAANHGIELQSISVGAVKAAESTAPGAATTVKVGAVLAIPVTLVSEGPEPEQLAFLRDIQIGGPRRALVLSIQFDSTSSIAKTSTMTVLVNVFTAPLSKADQAQLEKLLRGDISD
jgi:hypothetical protein